jgi:hypothetical protein
MTTRHLRLTRTPRALLRRRGGRMRVDVRVRTRGRDGVLRQVTARLTLQRSSSKKRS